MLQLFASWSAVRNWRWASADWTRKSQNKQLSSSFLISNLLWIKQVVSHPYKSYLGSAASLSLRSCYVPEQWKLILWIHRKSSATWSFTYCNKFNWQAQNGKLALFLTSNKINRVSNFSTPKFIEVILTGPNTKDCQIPFGRNFTRGKENGIELILILTKGNLRYKETYFNRERQERSWRTI